MLEKSSQMENILTQHDSMPPALTDAHTRKMENFLTQHDSMPPALTNAHTLEKSSQMKNFLTQYTGQHNYHFHQRKFVGNTTG